MAIKSKADQNGKKEIVESMNTIINKLDFEMIVDVVDQKAKQRKKLSSLADQKSKRKIKENKNGKAKNKISKQVSSRDYVRFTQETLDKLQTLYEENNYPNHEEIKQFAERFSYSSIKIDNWFKHKRRIEKKKGLLPNARKQRFSKDKLALLKKHFFVCKRPSYAEYVKISQEIETSVKSIQNWFAFKRKQMLKRLNKIIATQGIDAHKNKGYDELLKSTMAESTDEASQAELENTPAAKNKSEIEEILKKKKDKIKNELAEVLGSRLETFIKGMNRPGKLKNKRKKSISKHSESTFIEESRETDVENKSFQKGQSQEEENSLKEKKEQGDISQRDVERTPEEIKNEREGLEFKSIDTSSNSFKFAPSDILETPPQLTPAENQKSTSEEHLCKYCSCQVKPNPHGHPPPYGHAIMVPYPVFPMNGFVEDYRMIPNPYYSLMGPRVVYNQPLQGYRYAEQPWRYYN